MQRHQRPPEVSIVFARDFKLNLRVPSATRCSIDHGYVHQTMNKHIIKDRKIDDNNVLHYYLTLTARHW